MIIVGHCRNQGKQSKMEVSCPYLRQTSVVFCKEEGLCMHSSIKLDGKEVQRRL